MAPLQLKGCSANSFNELNHYPFGGVRAQALSVFVPLHFDHGVEQACSAAARVPPRSPCLGTPPSFFLYVARWFRTRRYHVRWIRCRRPVSITGLLPLRLFQCLHFCKRLCAVGTCSRASGRFSRARSMPSLAIVTHMSSSLKVSSTVTQSTGASGRVFPDAIEYQFDLSVSKACIATLR